MYTLNTKLVGGEVVRVVSKDMRRIPFKTLHNKVDTAYTNRSLNKKEFSKLRRDVIATGEIIGCEFVKADGSMRTFIGTLDGLGVTTHLQATDLDKAEANGTDGMIQVNLNTIKSITRIGYDSTVTYYNTL